MTDMGSDDVRAARTTKSASAYRTISEVSEELDVPQHVLRFWETRFAQVRPLKRGGGRRYYRPEDVKLLQRIQKLLYEEGYTIKGVQKLLREGRVAPDSARPAGPARPAATLFTDPSAGTADGAGDAGEDEVQALPDDVRAELTEVLDELKAIRQMLAERQTAGG